MHPFSLARLRAIRAMRAFSDGDCISFRPRFPFFGSSWPYDRFADVYDRFARKSFTGIYRSSLTVLSWQNIGTIQPFTGPARCAEHGSPSRLGYLSVGSDHVSHNLVLSDFKQPFS
jgi:hypothetical protein